MKKLLAYARLVTFLFSSLVLFIVPTNAQASGLTNTWTSYNDFNYVTGGSGSTSSQTHVTINGSGTPTDASAGSVGIAYTANTVSQSSSDFPNGTQSQTYDQAYSDDSGSATRVGLTETAGSITTETATFSGNISGTSCAEDSATHDIYCFGGNGTACSGHPVNECTAIEQYDPSSGILTTETATLPVGNQGQSCVEDSATHDIYCFSGSPAGATYGHQIIQFNPGSDIRTTEPATLPAGSSFATCAEDSATHMIYCFDEQNSIIYQYNPSNDTTTTMTATSPSEPVSCAEDSATNIIYCFGSTGSAYKYNPSNDTATALSAATPFDDFLRSCNEIVSTHIISCIDNAAPVAYDPASDSYTTSSSSFPYHPNEACTEDTGTGVDYCFGGSSSHIIGYLPQFNTTGNFTSSAIDLGHSAHYETLNFTENSPTNTSIEFQLRSAATEGGLSSATWYGPTSTSDFYTSSGTAINAVHNGNRYVQYKAYLSTLDDSVSPTLNSVSIANEYIPTTGSASVTQTSDTDFNAGTINQTAIVGTGSSASVDLETGGISAVSAHYTPARSDNACAPDIATDMIYCFGGLDTNGNNYQDIKQFDPTNDTVTTMTATLPDQIQDQSCAPDTSTNVIYCFGGQDQNGDLFSYVLKYDPSNDTVTTMSAQLASQRFGTSCAEDSATHLIYCFGGDDTNGFDNDIEQYDPSNDTMTTMTATLSTARYRLACAEDSSTNLIYCFGGQDSNGVDGDIQQYDPSHDVMGTMNSTFSPGFEFGSCVEDPSSHKIYCFGGDDGNGNFLSNEVYDPSQDVLNTGTASTLAENDYNSCALDSTTDEIYCFGGQDSNGDFISQIIVDNTGYLSSGDFTSSAIDLEEAMDAFGTLDFNTSVPANTTIEFQLRSAATASGLTSATWYGPTSTSDFYTSSGTAINAVHVGGRYIQYKAYLASTNPIYTSALNDITINFTRATPTLSELEWDAGSTVDGQTISWDATTPTDTSVAFQVRAADSQADLASASWSSDFTTSGSSLSGIAGEWFEVQALLLTTDNYNTPTLSDVTISTTAGTSGSNSGGGSNSSSSSSSSGSSSKTITTSSSTSQSQQTQTTPTTTTTTPTTTEQTQTTTPLETQPVGKPETKKGSSTLVTVGKWALGFGILAILGFIIRAFIAAKSA